LFAAAFLIYYPAKWLSFGDFSLPWICAYGYPIPFCIETLTSRNLSDEVDLGRVFGSVSSDSCDVVSVGADDVVEPLDEDGGGDTTDSSQEGSGGSIFASFTMIAAQALFASFTLMW
jgi:hypothetical protein